MSRPVLRYHGGKWRLAPWIISHFPTHRVYVEPFGGAASVLRRKKRVYCEVYNDLDGEVVNLFRVLRDPVQAAELVRLLELTPYSRAEFMGSFEAAEDVVEQARRTMTRSYLGYSTAFLSGQWKTGFRTNWRRTGTTGAHDWRNFPGAVGEMVERLRGVVIEERPALDVIQQYDGPDALFYVDPPYPWATRNKRWAGKVYKHELSDDDHRDLAFVLRIVEGMVVLSGYGCGLYDDELYPDWHRVEREALADGAQKRTEVLWISPRTWAALSRERRAVVVEQGALF